MNRFRIMMATASRSSLLLFTALAVAVIVFVSGIGASYADPAPGNAQLAARQAARTRQIPAALKEKYAAKQAADADHARAVRNTAIIQRKKQQDYTRKVLEGQGKAPAPDTGGAQ